MIKEMQKGFINKNLEICPIQGCKNKRQSRGAGSLRQCCRKHTQMKRILGYCSGELPNKKELHEQFYD